MSDASVVWTEASGSRAARWRSEAGLPPPREVRVVDDTLSASQAARLAGEGTGLLWRSDFHNARNLLQAMARRADRMPRDKPAAPASALEAFQQHRQTLARRALIAGKLLIELDGEYGIALPRAPDLRQACEEAWGRPDGRNSVAALRELLGLVGAHEWRKKGIEVAALGPGPGNRIHPHYGVFSPVRGEYLDLVAAAPLRSRELAFDIGTGTGVLAAILARRGVRHVVATDHDPRALACARANIARLGLAEQVEVVQADLFPANSRAALVVCNPPWVPARPSAPLEHAIYDEDSRMLRGFLAGLAGHLLADGEGWLIMSDLAEHLGLRSPSELPAWIEAAGLKVLARSDVRPRHSKAADPSDPLHAARIREVTSLWRLVPR